MKSTTGVETRYPAPALRVAFRQEDVPKVKKRRAGKSKEQEEITTEPKFNLPMFDDYRIKARDHDPL